MIRWTIPAVMLVALSGCSEREAHNPAFPEAYAVRLAVVPAPGAPLQRLSPPAELLAAFENADRSDLRLFDATGAVLPMAATAPPGGQAELRGIRLEALPILGSDDGRNAGDTVLSVAEAGGTRVVRVAQDSRADAAPSLVGVLLDSRSIAEPVRELRLEGRWPARQPISFTVAASENLRDWTTLGGRILYRKTTDAAGAIGSEAISLDNADLRHRYLRIGWSSPSKLLGPVEVTGATLVTARRTGSDRLAIDTTAPRRVDAHDIRFAVDHPVSLAALGITLSGGEMLVPVRLFGRNASDQGWTALGSAVLRGAAPVAVELQAPAFSDYRIEADRRTAGFAAPPKLALLFEPLPLVVLFSGKPPYTLAAGAADVENRYLPVGDLIPGYRPDAEAALPAATVVAATRVSLLSLAQDDSGRFDRRESLLWGLMLFGVGVLFWMVWRLWKGSSPRA